jgi:hypothetical protein
MKLSTPCRFALVSTVLLLSGSALSVTLTASQLQQFGQAADTDVIVILRDQVTTVPPARGNMLARASAVGSAQTPILTQLRQAHAGKIRTFGLINAVATRVSKAEAERLAADPLVQAVVPDRVIRLPARRDASAATGRTATRGLSSARAMASPNVSSQPICPSDPSQPLLEPEALQLTNTAFTDPTIPQAQTVLDGNGQPVLGTGVKVAFIADGLDPNIPDFMDFPHHTHVIIDYQDFSGDGIDAPTEGAEAFGDASSIASQGNQTFDLSGQVNPAHPLPPGCNIKVRGMAPGASLVALKVFSSEGLTTTSGFVQAIEYAVTTDNVDIINESFGGAPFPDNDNDPISLANSAAVAAGVTVVVSTGDAGTAGTLGSPSTDTGVIAVGGTTQYRLYAQTTMAAIQLGGNGYISNNISPLSSGGFAQTKARTVDVVAPGDLGWADCSTNTAMFTGCFDTLFGSNPQPIQDFGGTSESTPLTSGEAALIIQAYRSTHHGADPTPALVKRIIMSTATDLGAPSFEQGAGLINSLAAVQAALSFTTGNGQIKGHGQGIVTQPTAIRVTDAPGTQESQQITVTNTGTTVQHLAPTLQMLAAPFAGATLNLTLDPATAPTYINASGSTRSFLEQQFTVPAGAQHLDAAIAYNTVGEDPNNPPIVYLHLFDPSGRLAQYSIPQGFGSGYGHVDVNHPLAGNWTAVVATRPSGTGSYTGPVVFTWSVENYTSFGHVLPAHADLQPGASVELTAHYSMPANPGDLSAAVRLGPAVTQSGGGPEVIPVSLRTLIRVGADGGSFAGTLTGGNGRAGNAPTQTFAFDVPHGAKNMGLSLSLNDAGNPLQGLLVDPNGMQLSVQPNLDPTDPGGTAGTTLQLFHYNPQPGRWRFVLLQNYMVSGHQTSLPFTAHISFFNNHQAASGNLPNDPHEKLSASAGPVTIPIRVTNNGNSTELYFADARLATPVATQLPTFLDCAAPQLPGGCALTSLAPETTSVSFAAQAPVPINMDAFNEVGSGVGGTGAPDIFASQTAPDTVTATLTSREIPYGLWVMSPALIGPYPATGAPGPYPFTTTAVALMQPFDTAMSPDSGDVWTILTFGTGSFSPLVLAPGQSGTINVTITPDPSKIGEVVSGFVYIDTYHPLVSTGDEVVSLPYSYRVAH